MCITESYHLSKQVISATLREVRYVKDNVFSIPRVCIPLFQTYFLRSWSASYTLDNIVQGMIPYKDVEYMVVYHRCNHADLTQAAKDNQQLLLSFRTPIVASLSPTVLITIK